jgi:hypothetical protein
VARLVAQQLRTKLKMKLDARMLRYLTADDFRVLTAVRHATQRLCMCAPRWLTLRVYNT